MIINQKTQILSDDNQLAIATKEQEGNLVASGGANDLTCLVDNGELAVKVVSMEGESSTNSSTSTEVLADGELATATIGQDGNILASGGATSPICLVETENGTQTALKTFTLNGNVLAQGDKTCLVEVDGKKQLALKAFFLSGGGGGTGTYYAYTDSNNNTIYTKNAIADAGTFTLQNATSYHQYSTSLTEDNGVFSDFSHSITTGYRYLTVDVTHPTTDMELIIRANPLSSYGDLLKTDPDARGILLRCTAASVVAYVASSAGTNWNVLTGFNTGISLAANKFTYVKISWNSTTGAYSFAYSNDGITWTAGNTSSGSLASPYWGSESTQNIGGNAAYSEIWGGSVDMACSQLTVDGVTTKYGSITGASTLYDSNLVALSTQPRFILSSGNIVINNVTYTRDSTKDRQG